MKIKKIDNLKQTLRPLINVRVPAGFPSPADNFTEDRLDLNDFVTKNDTATFYMQVEGDSMIDANIFDGDIIVVDRSIQATHGKVVVAILDGEFTVKTLFYKDNVIKLVPQNDEYPEIILKKEQELNIWGVVSYVVHKV
jgi:DNA polymerase V